MELKHVALVMADIGGYTRFIKFHKTALLHAQEIISHLIEAIIDRASFPLILNKLPVRWRCVRKSPRQATKET